MIGALVQTGMRCVNEWAEKVSEAYLADWRFVPAVQRLRLWVGLLNWDGLLMPAVNSLPMFV